MRRSDCVRLREDEGLVHVVWDVSNKNCFYVVCRAVFPIASAMLGEAVEPPATCLRCWRHWFK